MDWRINENTEENRRIALCEHLTEARLIADALSHSLFEEVRSLSEPTGPRDDCDWGLIMQARSAVEKLKEVQQLITRRTR
jgi:hypothetical protein